LEKLHQINIIHRHAPARTSSSSGISAFGSVIFHF